MTRLCDRRRGTVTYRRAIGVVALLATAVALVVSVMPSGWRIAASNAVGKALLAPLVDRFAHGDIGDVCAYHGVIALGGSHRRVARAVELAVRCGQLAVVVTGSDAAAAKVRLAAAGIDRARVRLEPNARSTWDDAVLTARLLGPDRGQRWLLVTSDFHVARAVGSFSMAGIDVTPVPIRELQQGSQRWLHHACHEWVGLIAYRLLGRTRRLLPGPKS